MTIDRLVLSREPDGTMPNGFPYWQLTRSECETMGKAHPRAWRIDWSYIMRGEGCWSLMSAGEFHGTVERMAWLESKAVGS